MKYLCLLLCLSGCRLKQYDEVTAEQVSRTIAFETEDFALLLDALADGALDEKERMSLEVRHESELERLRAWLKAEEAKEVTP